MAFVYRITPSDNPPRSPAAGTSTTPSGIRTVTSVSARTSLRTVRVTVRVDSLHEVFWNTPVGVEKTVKEEREEEKLGRTSQSKVSSRRGIVGRKVSVSCVGRPTIVLLKVSCSCWKAPTGLVRSMGLGGIRDSPSSKSIVSVSWFNSSPRTGILIPALGGTMTVNGVKAWMPLTTVKTSRPPLGDHEAVAMSGDPPGGELKGQSATSAALSAHVSYENAMLLLTSHGIEVGHDGLTKHQLEQQCGPGSSHSWSQGACGVLSQAPHTRP
mmetsp:Transcript_34965/g.83134  ORF Transcript_34965/g.83134 Transcript_34965/m.83134 type:complete len:269 (+) Transcript_34965:1833-2639(+)